MIHVFPYMDQGGLQSVRLRQIIVECDRVLYSKRDMCLTLMIKGSDHCEKCPVFSHPSTKTFW